MRKIVSSFGLLVASSVLAVTAANAVPVIGAPIIVASTGNVVATFVGSNAGYNDQLGLVGGPSVIFDNQTSTVGSTYDLGVFTAGTVLTFSLYVTNTKYTFFSGPATGNPDGVAHASVDVGLNGTTVGFEDTFNGGDRDYNDLTFSFTNTTTAAVPEAATWAMFIGGFGLVGSALRRRRTTISFA